MAICKTHITRHSQPMQPGGGRTREITQRPPLAAPVNVSLPATRGAVQGNASETGGVVSLHCPVSRLLGRVHLAEIAPRIVRSISVYVVHLIRPAPLHKGKGNAMRKKRCLERRAAPVAFAVLCIKGQTPGAFAGYMAGVGIIAERLGEFFNHATWYGIEEGL